MNICNWVKEHTEGYQCTVEFGAMYGEKLNAASTPKKIALEIHEPYLVTLEAITPPLIIEHCDFREYERRVAPADRDVALFVDTLEHVTKADALELMARVQQDFNRVLLMIPVGSHPQEGHSGNPFQAHLSTWETHDIHLMGFQHIEDLHNFHGPGSGCVFAVWTKVILNRE